MTTYIVEVKSVAGYTKHSEHDSYRDAVDQADMVHGVVMVDTGLSDREAWSHAVRVQGCELSFAEWSAQGDEEREAWEYGAGRSEAIEINIESEAYNTGYEAHEQGEARSANPYASSWDAANWAAGWEDAAGEITRLADEYADGCYEDEGEAAYGRDD